uniref:Uncharacterized protein n=1 Tax=viral metagenome TaxID=1070528 RepID=A0A6C0L7B9_9ZZZZ
MESVVNYLEDAEKKLRQEMSALFSKMKEQRDTMSLEGIEDMYTYTPVEGVLYEPCVRIPGQGGYYCSEYKLPKDEYVIIIKTSMSGSTQQYQAVVYSCIALTNYGRLFLTHPIFENRAFGGYSYHSPANDTHIHCATHGQSPSQILPIIKLEPLPYKMPEFFIRTYRFGMGMPDPAYCTYSRRIPESVEKSILKATASLQELNKEFYLFAGKWKPHMTEHATLDVDTMRQTIIDNAHSIEEIKVNEESLAQQNKILQAELKELKEQNVNLEKEKARLLPLEKYKDAVIDFMDNHYDGDERWLSNVEHDDDDKPIDTDIIKYYSDWHTNKVFMEEWEYDDVMESKEELNEYRIYKRVKGGMVSSGMDNSSVAKNVHSIKKTINKLKI